MTIDPAAVDAAIARVQIERPVSPADAMLLADAVVALRERLAAECEARKQLGLQQYEHPWTVNEAAREKMRADSAEKRLAESLESLRVIRSHLLCVGGKHFAPAAMAELDAIIGKVGG